MPKIFNSPFGEISGKHGSAVASITKYGNILRKHNAPSNPNTPKQQAHRAKFGLVNQSLIPLTAVLKKGYRSSDARQKAVAQAIRDAISGTYPNYEFNYSCLLIAVGALPPPQTATATVVNESTEITVNWDTTIGFKSMEANPKDHVQIVFFNEKAKLSVISENIALRETGTVSVMLPTAWKGKKVHGWLYVSGGIRSVNSDSVYIGLLQL